MHIKQLHERDMRPAEIQQAHRGPRLRWALAAAVVIASLAMTRVGPRLFSSTPRAAAVSVREALDPHTGTLLAPLLRPRVAGTPGGAAARQHIAAHLEQSGWTVDIHNFTAQAPFGEVAMANVVSRRNAPAAPSAAHRSAPRLTLAAHYDSKQEPAGFVGAIDSAFPCALLLWLASLPAPKRDFDLIFFDGEESFREWSDDDSLYGARALAEHQAQAGALPSTLVLLDLIGHHSRFPIPSWFPNTQGLHAELQRIDPRLVGGRNLHEYAGMMLDDHVPYLARGVPVLHLIPPSFPPEWHTLGDNADFLHWPTMEAWASLLHKWLYE